MCYTTYASDIDPFSTPPVFYTYFYNHARRFRLEKPLYTVQGFLEANGFFNALLDLGGRHVPRPFQKRSSYKFITVVCDGHSPTNKISRSGETAM
jgi:hypothetical protein